MMPIKQSEIERIVELTEDIIENTGVIVQHKELLKMIKSAGADVDEESQNVKIPRELLRKLLESVPEVYTVEDGDGNEYSIGKNSQHTLAIVTDPWIIDYDTGDPRKPCLEDVRKHTIIGQKLENVITMSRMDFPVTDYNDPTSSLRALEQHLLNNNKHISIYPASYESYAEWMEIAHILTQGKDISKSRLFTVAVAFVSPLILGHWNAKLLIDVCKNNFPIVPTICPMAGTTSPYNKAASILQANAENIFLAAVSQIVRPGVPYRYGYGISVTDMRTGHDMYYTMDINYFKIVAVQLAKAYNMPSGVSCGGTMTFRHDIQSGAEGMLLMLSAQRSGANLLGGIGSCYNALGMSAEMMIIQSEWYRLARYLSIGIDFSDLEQGAQSIMQVGPGGHFLTDDLTLKHLRTDEFFKSNIMDMSGGNYKGIPMLEKAHQKVEELVENYESPVSHKIQEGLTRYFYDKYKRIHL